MPAACRQQQTCMIDKLPFKRLIEMRLRACNPASTPGSVAGCFSGAPCTYLLALLGLLAVLLGALGGWVPLLPPEAAAQCLSQVQLSASTSLPGATCASLEASKRWSITAPLHRPPRARSSPLIAAPLQNLAAVASRSIGTTDSLHDHLPQQLHFPGPSWVPDTSPCRAQAAVGRRQPR